MKSKAILTDYFEAIAEVARQGDKREESFYGCLETLLRQFAAPTGGLGRGTLQEKEIALLALLQHGFRSVSADK